MPSPSTVFLWRIKYQEFLEQYARACEERTELFAEEIIDIADNIKRDKKPIYEVDENGKKVLVGYTDNKLAVRRDQLRIDARKWTAVRLLPKKFGDKLEVGGGLKNEVSHKYADKTDDELMDILAQHLAERKRDTSDNTDEDADEQ